MPELQCKQTGPRLRFTLRVLLVALTLVCVGLGWWTQRAREQRQAVKRIVAAGSEVRYDMDESRSLWSKWKRWLSRHLGADFVYGIDLVNLRDPALVGELQPLPHVNALLITSAEVTDEHVEQVAQLHGLKSLRIGASLGLSHRANPTIGSQLTDRALKAIGQMPAIEILEIEGVGFTTDGLLALAKCSRLSDAHIRWCRANVAPTDLQPLRAAGRVKRLVVLRWSGEVGEEVVAEW
jgi:hypothetical protein